MKFLFSLSLFFLITCVVQSQPISLKKAWESDTLFRTPESSLYYNEQDIIFVTNMNAIHDDEKDGDGFISILNPNGKIATLNWITGLNDPKGLGIFNGKLYVGDLTQLVEIDIAKGKITQRYDADDALMLNDIAILPNGDVFATDTRKNRVYRLSEGKLTLFMDNQDLNRPNGLFYDSNSLLMTSMGSGLVTRFDPSTKRTPLGFQVHHQPMELLRTAKATISFPIGTERFML